MIAGTLTCLRAEHYRLVRSRSTWVAVLLLTLLSALRVALAFVFDTVEHARRLQRAQAAGEGLPDFELSNAWAPFVDGWRTGLIVGTLLLVVAAGANLAADRRSGVLRTAATRSVSRGGLLLGRMLLGVPVVLAVVACTGLGAWLAAEWLFEFGPLVARGVTLIDGVELAVELRAAVLAALPPMFATWCFGLAVSAAAGGAVQAVASCLVLLVGFDVFKGLLGEAQYWVFAAFVPSPQDGSWMNEMSGVARGYIDVGYSTAQANMNHVLPWAWSALFLLLAGFLIGRRSL